ncbi:hypothetical protein GOBAR_AA03873 [Gossypium barbadense]|uniref:SWIM-type domain-containing protein n=1 Tax=Gossypium barbadense TaxID=3634 RepID=A0A2P5YMA9_GOSBA|nr:hypothetical protein GOBAR_AA03873 [Gossypium barbadense]
MDPIKFTEIELVDDEDMETMVALYCHSNQNAPIHLFAELAVVESTEDPTPLGEEDRPQEPCMVVPISYVGSQSTTHRIEIDLNATPEIDVGDDDVYRSSDPSDYEVDIDSDPDMDDVPDDIDNEGVNKDGNINASLVGNQIHRIVIHNKPEAHISQIDPDSTHAAEFPEYPEILPAHQMAIYSDPEELFVGQRFESKEECLFAIKRYSINISVDYKVVESKLTLYIGECWKSAEGCKWRIRAAFIQKSQMWEIQKFARFQYRVSYRKAWIAKQMAMEQLYGNFDASSNELQGWIAAMREYVPGTRMTRLESDMEGQTNASFRQWLGSMEPWQWAQSFDEGFRYGQMSTNLVEGINAQQVNQMEAGHVFVEHVRDAMVANRRMLRSMNVEVYSRRNETFRVIEAIGRRPGIPLRSYGVDLRNRCCDCRRFQTLHYPCAHVVAACAKVSLNVDQFIDEVVAGHNRSKCPLRNYHTGQSSQSDRN